MEVAFDEADDEGKVKVVNELRDNGFDNAADELEKRAAKELDSHRSELTTDLQ